MAECPHCHRYHPITVGWSSEHGSTPRLASFCSACGLFIKWLPETKENLSIAPERPTSPPPPQGRLFA